LTPVAPILVLAVGNPSRGDDALGTTLLDRAEALLQAEIDRGEVEFLTDFQLQVEHALDLQGRRLVIFADASVTADGVAYEPLQAERDQSFSSHALSPAAVLDTYRQLFGEPPPAYTLAIRGAAFELFEDLSDLARQNLDRAVAFLVAEVQWQLACQTWQLRVQGTVQGVGFRPWLLAEARRLGLRGSVGNSAQGVEILAQGPEPALLELREALHSRTPPAARVSRVEQRGTHWQPLTAFEISPTTLGGELQLSIPPDLGLCGDCERDLAAPLDRHFGYAFTTCTACGPRYSVGVTLPYDRAATTLSEFPLCPACARDYGDVADRRFHAQAIACPQCGPQLWLTDAQGQPLATPAPLQEAADRLLCGEILAIQGLGGFHLACDASQSAAVQRLRDRKHREAKPLAIMALDLASLEPWAELDAVTSAALLSPIRPIVLLPRRDNVRGGHFVLAPEVCAGSPQLGAMLAYTPLHRLLLQKVGRPLVMTSGNLSGEPIAVTLPEALDQLGQIADVWLAHNRPIARRVEDSLVAPLVGQLRVLRRARGYVPSEIRLPIAALEPVLAVGGHLKNTACVVIGDRAWLTPHLGDLDSVAAEEAFVRELEGFEQLLGVRAQVLAHDLHPDYAATQYAQQRPARLRVGVQHHVAHLLAAAAEFGLQGPLLGWALDGTGWGPDGTAWGGELLSVHGLEWHRPASLRALPLPGGEQAIRQTWRSGYSALRAAFGDEADEIAKRLPAFRGVTPAQLLTVQRMLQSGVQVPRSRGLGRWFDAVGALLLGLPRAAFEGQVAMALQDASANPEWFQGYPVGSPSEFSAGIEASEANEIDLRPTVRAVVDDILSGRPTAFIAARFHRTLIDVLADTARAAFDQFPAEALILSGGAMQNRWLAEGLHQRLADLPVRMAAQVPVGDGGLALGQAFAAVLQLQQDARSTASDRS
jgi:hydrogenase maturation protein HypF